MVIKNGAFLLCSLYTVFVGNSPFVYSPAPRGNCAGCCEIRETKDIQFFLYTRTNPHIPEQLFISDSSSIISSNLNKSNPLILYIHGFSERALDGKGQSAQEIRDAFLEIGNYNVILVDWSPLTAMPWYTYSVKNGPKVARNVAKFLRHLVQSNVPLENIHVIGFSLGAEVAGFAGKILIKSGITLPRITGLDPAFPLYNSGGASTRLSSADAKFVDVIHTDGGVLGHPWPLGHADFYPNGGVPLQPGCAQQEIARSRWLNVIFGCSHQRAWEYFVESIRYPKAFLASICKTKAVNGVTRKCNQTTNAYMGLIANETLHGKFYLTTNGQRPFGNSSST